MSKIFYILATGPSINDITEEEWEFLKDKNTISFAGFPFSGIQTKYYYSHEGVLFDKWYIDLMAENKYFDTVMILSHKESMVHARSKGFKEIIPFVKLTALFLPGRKGWFTDEKYPPYPFKMTRAKSFMEPIFRFRGQLSGVINSATILGATEIHLIGVDLTCQNSFFDVDPSRWIKSNISNDIYNERCKFTNESLQKFSMNRVYSWKNYDGSIMHTTSIPYIDEKRWGKRALRPMQDVVDWMDDELRKEGMKGIFITNKKSVLYTQNLIEYRSII